jgi:hypothetical protein
MSGSGSSNYSSEMDGEEEYELFKELEYGTKKKLEPEKEKIQLTTQ